MRQDISFQPIITEKALKMAEAKKYTFLVNPGATKHKIREAIGKVFGVSVMSVHTRTQKGQKVATVRVGEKDKIELFETEEKKKGKRPTYAKASAGKQKVK